MKDALRLPLIFLLFFILVIIFFSGLSLLSLWGSLYSENPDTVKKLVLERAPATFKEMLPMSVLLALVFLLFRIVNNPGNRFLSFIIPIGAAFAVLVFGYSALKSIGPGPVGNEVTPARYLIPGRFNYFEDRSVYVASLSGNKAENIIITESNNRERHLAYYPDGEIEAGEEGLVLFVPGSEPLTFSSKPVFADLFAQDRFGQDFFQDIRLLNQELDRLFRESKTGFFLLGFALILSFFSISVFMRISKWPLFNLLLGILVMRLLFYIFRFVRGEIARELKSILGDQGMFESLPAFILMCFGALMLIIDILFVPFDRWKRELRGA